MHAYIYVMKHRLSTGCSMNGKGFFTVFLDTLLQRKDGGSLEITVYWKPTRMDRYLDKENPPGVLPIKEALQILRKPKTAWTVTPPVASLAVDAYNQLMNRTHGLIEWQRHP